MTKYGAEAEKAVKKFDKNSQGTQKNVASIADTAQSFLKDIKGNAGDMACEATKYIKDEGQKSVRKAEKFVKEHPAKGALYALGIGAALAFIFMPRNK